MEEGDVNEPVNIFGLPPLDDMSLRIRHSLFIDVSTIALAEATNTDLLDLCSSSFLLSNRSNIPREFSVSNACSAEVECETMTQSDWLHLLMQICDRRLDVNATAISSLSIRSNRPVLILTRFAASLITYLSMLFSSVSLSTCIAFNNRPGEIISCQQVVSSYSVLSFTLKASLLDSDCLTAE
uniref:Uncharacterized protein n=1 Tax=Ascaris lumbricoides TaxID=6252 RepID=A0A0M3IF02_ASCLU